MGYIRKSKPKEKNVKLLLKYLENAVTETKTNRKTK